jgi:antitoxin component of MazEF toxin-antitoxin module
MPKVRKYNNALFVSIPQSMADALGIKEGDELEFLKHSDTSLVLAKKNDLLKLLEEHRDTAMATVQVAPKSEIDGGELELLKKLDTLRYNDRTKEKVDAMLDEQEQILLRRLIARKTLTLYRKDSKEPFRYSIPKAVYDKFLYRKGKKEEPQQATSAPIKSKTLDRTAMRKWDDPSNSDYMTDLETNGYVVLKSEADAASASAALEESIKQGLVIGTRAFDKKFYIGLRGFINKNAPKILKALDGKSAKAEEIASELGINSEGVKTILYILAESGDVTEVRRDIFRVA